MEPAGRPLFSDSEPSVGAPASSLFPIVRTTQAVHAVENLRLAQRAPRAQTLGHWRNVYAAQ